MEILMWSTIFVFSLAILVKSADIFTDSAERIGIHFKISPFIIGVTIVALGTSLPELATSIVAVLRGDSGMVVANVVGSNVANIMLVLGVSAIIGKHLIVDKDIINIDLPLLLGSAILLFVTTIDGEFNFADGIISILALITYLVYNAKSGRKINEKHFEEISHLKKEEQKRKKLGIKAPALLLLSTLGIWLSADYTIESVINISRILNLATEVVAATAIALGTSLPELFVSIIAIKKGKIDMAIGNVTGSNIFNTLGVMGVPALFGTLSISEDMISFAIPFMMFATILYMFVTMDKRISNGKE